MTDREKIISAFMELLGEEPIEDIGLADVAARSGVSLAQMRGEFSSIMSILAASVKDTDRRVLAGGEDMLEEPVRERLFDVLMRRLEILTPHKKAIRSLMGSALRNPPLALALNGLGTRSMHWMMTAAGIKTKGPKGMARAQGLSLLFGRVVSIWVDDEDPGLARTMAALDRELSRGERWSGFLDDLFCIPEALLRARSFRGRRRRPDDEGLSSPLP